MFPMGNSSCEILCVGLIGADHVCGPLANWPDPGTLVATSGITLTVGGSAANVAVDLARLGISVALNSCIGQDLHGRFLQEFLERSGVNCEALQVSPSLPSSQTLVINVAGEDRRFLHDYGACAELTGLDIPDSLWPGCRAVCVAGLGLNTALSGENVTRLFQRAHRQGALTVLDVVFADPQQAFAMVKDALPETDVFLPNTDEARLMTGLSDPLEQAACFHQFGAKTVVITLGAKGAILSAPECGLLRFPAYDVQQVDGTGSGDAFLAGYLYAFLKGYRAEDCMRFGSALGASCVQTLGATSGVFNAMELEEFVKQRHLEYRITGEEG
jgi:sugar/nucleoside kinase (ribokinase family)